MLKKLAFAVLVLSNIIQCVVAPEFPDIPEITFEGMNKNIIAQGRQRDDTIQIKIGFTDGDGDIGDENNTASVFLIDDRDGNSNSYSMPMIPQKGIANGVKGTITIFHTTLLNVCCYYRNADPCSVPSIPTTNTVNYKIYIKDRKGNKSNTVTISPLVIECK